MLVFEERGKLEFPEKNAALTTAPTLLPNLSSSREKP